MGAPGAQNVPGLLLSIAQGFGDNRNADSMLFDIANDSFGALVNRIDAAV